MNRVLKTCTVFAGLLAAASVQAVTLTYTASGNWTVPAGVTTIKVEVWGGGGAGGGNTTNADGGGGGGGGGYSSTSNITVTEGEICTFTVGAGGTGNAGAAGGDGGSTSISGCGGIAVSVNGGAGGLPPVAGAGGLGGAGGAGGTGATSFAGGNGGTGRNNNTGRGGPGGSSAGTTANGASGTDPYSTMTAAAAPTGGGIGGNGGDAGQNGFAPASGNGGGGGGSGDTGTRTGGNGAGGKVVISYPTVPVVSSISLASTNPTAANTAVSWTVVFDQSVTGVDAGDFVLVESDGATGSSLTSVTGSGTTWTVTANTGTGVSGLLGLNLIDNDSILSADSLPLGGAGANNGNFTGAIYTIDFTPIYVFTNGACTHNTAIGGGGCTAITWSPQVAGQALTNIYITNVSAAGIPTRLHATNTRTRNIAFRLACYNPVAHAGVSAIFSVTSLLCSPTTWSAAEVVSFPGGSPSAGPYSFNYDDVGKVELWMRNSAATTSMGSSGTFVVKPAGFLLSNIVRTSDGAANPAAANAAGAAFVKAGEAFSVTVTALTVGGKAKADAGIAVDCGAVPPVDCTPNYGQETVKESAKLTPTLLAGLGLTNNPALNGSFGAFTAGVATGTAFNWDEVGIITLTPSVGDGDYLGAGDVTGTTSTNVGRFYLDHFSMSAPSLVNRADYCPAGAGCPAAFTYMDEQINAAFTLVPMSLNNVALKNYVDSALAENDFAKLDPTVFADLNLAAVDTVTTGGPHYLSARISNAGMPVVACATSPCFQLGATQAEAVVTAPCMFSRDAAEDGPYSAVKVGIAPQDADGAGVVFNLDTDATAGNDHALLGTAEFRYGRLRVSNAYGSELLPLAMSATAQYYTADGWVNSVADSITALSLSASYDVVKNGVTTGTTVPSLTSGTLASGNLNFTLAKPSGGATGVAAIAPTAPAYLPVVEGAVTFGIYKGNNNYIYRRESY